MNYIITGLDPDEIRKQTQKGRVAAAKVYYEIRKDFSQRWYTFKDADDVLRVIDYLLDGCLENMQRALDKAPIESRCGNREGIGTTGISVSLGWTRFNQEDRDKHAERYRGDYLNDYVVLNITFEIIDTYQYREKK